MFLRNAWYVAAWDREVGRELLPLTILGEALVFFRQTDGQVVALHDACPHRKLPLSMGRLKDNTVECGYHGLTFDGTGACVRAPGMQRPPPRACVRAYPVVSRYGLLWVWMGEPDQADPSRIFQVAQWGDPAWGVNQGDGMQVNCNYLDLTDNLLDPSHVAWVHPGSFANVACEDTPLEITQSDQGLTVWRWMKAVEPAPFYAPFLKFKGLCDRKQHYEMRYPCHALIRAIFVPAGSGGEGRPLHPDAFIMDSFNFMTPVDEHTTRYHWFQMRNFAPNDAEVSRQFAVSVRAAFEEDRVVLEAVHRGMTADGATAINLPIDAGPLKFRRKMAERIAMEEARAARPDLTFISPGA
jgi:phenylpropionate dioxygenase-like ring-hydroxylating dioxygenase large terminal subunit